MYGDWSVGKATANAHNYWSPDARITKHSVHFMEREDVYNSYLHL